MRRIVFSISLVAGVLFSTCETRYEEIPPDLPETISVVGTVDPEWRVRSLDGAEIPLSHFAGKKLFINIWGTWCAPCRAELPHLQTLYNELKTDTTVAFLFVSDEPDTTVRSFVAKNSYSLPFYVCEKAKPKLFDTGAYPSTFIVNSRGDVVYRRTGTARWSHPSVIEFLRTI